ncbi:MAG: hypothetical protein EOO24_05805 [Comamonadaceae bacterium]|nr:MAG: hypothetical protein EOO24_05805 [Comamonadaceae bacterium]
MFVGLTVVSLSIYQSIFLYAASLICIGLAIEAAEGGFSTGAAVRLVLRYAVLTAVALVLNSMLARSVAGHYGVAISSYLSSMVGWGKAPPTDVVRSVWMFAKDYFSFRAPFGLNAFAFSALWAAGAVACSFRLRLGALRVAVLCLAALGSAFLLTLVLGVGLPPRTMTQVPLVFAGLFATFVVAARWRLLALPVAAVFLVSGAAGSTRLFYSDHMARVADRQLAGEIVDAIYARYPSFDVARTPVFFYGSHRPHNAWRLPDSDVFGASFFEWDGGNNSRMYRYLSVANIIELKIPDAAQVKTAIEDARGLRAWPDRSAVQMSHDVVIVKLGDVLSPYNK